MQTTGRASEHTTEVTLRPDFTRWEEVWRREARTPTTTEHTTWAVGRPGDQDNPWGLWLGGHDAFTEESARAFAAERGLHVFKRTTTTTVTGWEDATLTPESWRLLEEAQDR